MRKEKDSLGEMSVPDDVLYGIHTVRSLENFSSAGEPLPSEIIHGMVRIKWACSAANARLGLLEEKKAEAICKAAERILAGEFADQFPVDAFQAGSGTSSHMTVNEVLTNIACEELGGKRGDRSLVHPNDDVNKGQSTNNVFPSAVKIAAVLGSASLVDEAEHFAAALREKAQAFLEVIKSGRTHLQDAVPVTLGQEFAAYASAVEKDISRIRHAREKLFELGVGGNAVGTGLNTKPDFREKVIHELRALTSEPFLVAENGLEATQFLTDLAEMSCALKLLAVDINKIANDLRLLGSGPNTGLGEIVLPAVEPGSSIMPGKINPSICEAANMACMQVMGNDHAITLACAAGQLELNTHMPLVGLNLVKSLRILTATVQALATKCVAGIKANADACKANVERSAGLATVLNPVLGYDKVAELVKESLQSDKSLRELVIEKKIMPEDEWNELTQKATGPNL